MKITPLPHDGAIEIEGENYNHLGTLKDDFFAQTELLEKDGRKYLYKISRLTAVRWPKLQWVMNKFTAHEVKIHNLLEGVDGVPRLVKQVSENAFLREFVEGRTLDRNPPFMRRDFFVDFHNIVNNIHSRGVAFVDLAKKENVVCTDDGRPFLIDFQISFARSSQWWNPLAWLWNRAVKIMQTADVYHVNKHNYRIRPEWMTEDSKQAFARKPFFNRLHKYIFRLPYHAVKRRIIPKHGDSRYPFYEGDQMA